MGDSKNGTGVPAGGLPAKEVSSSCESAYLLPQELNVLIERGYARADLVRLIGRRGTIERKLKCSICLDPQESDRLARLSRMIAKAEAVFGSAEKARHWMERSLSRLFLGQSPLSMLNTDRGLQEVTERLLQIEHGIFD